ncbi:MAG: hypothetical protein AVDCRST_MAG55-1045 [uncultured Rubrobacteraceae bacterium]|uniref:Uncharacterized protein n=1 Tax=uncultured Rubrobacteraceae bacterium TaxID=349277 RepID=A0A6J4P9P9_9ACTN|nr:MAG: hypothetical protein AVDCRST_MAG55-1045 [uncultured Rubrobacteraceae bacterium]
MLLGAGSPWHRSLRLLPVLRWSVAAAEDSTSLFVLLDGGTGDGVEGRGGDQRPMPVKA